MNAYTFVNQITPFNRNDLKIIVSSFDDKLEYNKMSDSRQINEAEKKHLQITLDLFVLLPAFK